MLSIISENFVIWKSTPEVFQMALYSINLSNILFNVSVI